MNSLRGVFLSYFIVAFVDVCKFTNLSTNTHDTMPARKVEARRSAIVGAHARTLCRVRFLC